jgi:hypothetical protein
MILVRDIFQAKYGKGNELVALFKEARQKWPEAEKYGSRILTDASGTFIGSRSPTAVRHDLDSPHRGNVALRNHTRWTGSASA